MVYDGGFAKKMVILEFHRADFWETGLLTTFVLFFPQCSDFP